MTEHGTDLGKGLVIQRGVPLRFGQVGAQRPPHLRRANRAAAETAAAKVVQHLPQADTEGQLYQPATTNIARQLQRQGAARAAAAQ